MYLNKQHIIMNRRQNIKENQHHIAKDQKEIMLMLQLNPIDLVGTINFQMTKLKEDL